jgi:hypothetical protein
MADRAAGFWHVLGTKTLPLIHRHVHLEAARDDLETLVMDTTENIRSHTERRL